MNPQLRVLAISLSILLHKSLQFYDVLLLSLKRCSFCLSHQTSTPPVLEHANLIQHSLNFKQTQVHRPEGLPFYRPEPVPLKPCGRHVLDFSPAQLFPDADDLEHSHDSTLFNCNIDVRELFVDLLSHPLFAPQFDPLNDESFFSCLQLGYPLLGSLSFETGGVHRLVRKVVSHEGISKGLGLAFPL